MSPKKRSSPQILTLFDEFRAEIISDLLNLFQMKGGTIAPLLLSLYSNCYSYHALTIYLALNISDKLRSSA